MDINGSLASSESSNPSFCSTGIREPRKFFNLVSQIRYGEELDENPLEDLEEILKLTWNVYAVSTIFNFDSEDKVKMKAYGKRLREEIATNLSKDNVSYESKFTLLDMRRPKETDPAVVMIDVVATVTSDDTDKQTTVFKGYFISWGSDCFNLKTNCTVLPLHLCRGTPSTIKAVHDAVTKMFDCFLTPLPLRTDDLRWLLAILITPGSGQDCLKKADDIRLEYAIPGQSVTDTLTIRYSTETLINLWNKILGDRNKIDIDCIEQFHKVLSYQALSIGGLQVDLCFLHKLYFPTAVLSGNKIKVTNMEVMNTMLLFLNEKAIEALHVNTTHLVQNY